MMKKWIYDFFLFLCINNQKYLNEYGMVIALNWESTMFLPIQDVGEATGNNIFSCCESQTIMSPCCLRKFCRGIVPCRVKCRLVLSILRSVCAWYRRIHFVFLHPITRQSYLNFIHATQKRKKIYFISKESSLSFGIPKELINSFSTFNYMETLEK